MRKHELPELPFPVNALEPYVSAETLEFHHGKHHRAYVEKLNQLIAGTEFESASLDAIVLRSTGAIFNNAGQHWNHSFFWNCLTPPSDFREPEGPFADALARDFGSRDALWAELKKAAIAQFGSGWAWLVRGQDRKLSIVSTPNAENPLRQGLAPLLTVDVWEHAYYIDYRNDRARFLDAIPQILNWSFVERNFESERREIAA